MSVQMQQRRGTAAAWTAANPTLADGEIGWETDTSKFKVGNGATAWNSLGYFTSGSGTVTTVSVVSTNGFSGSVANPTTTPAITLSCSVAAGLVKSNGSGALVAAVAGTDFLTPTGSAAGLTGLTSGQVTGALTFTPYNATNPSGFIALTTAITGYTSGANTALAATDTLLAALGKVQGQINARQALATILTTLSALTNASGVLTNNGSGTLSWAASGGTGTVTSVSVATANGFAGTVANATTTPAITLTTSVTGLLKGNGTGVSAAAAGTDYVAPGGALGTPSSGVLTNCTGTAAGLTAGNASQLLGGTWAAPGTIGGTTPGVVNGTTGNLSCVNVSGNTGAVSGGMFFGASGGLTIWPKTGSANDFSLLNAGATAHVLDNPTGTNNLIMTAGGTFTTSGGVVPNVGTPSWASTMTLTVAGLDRIRITLGGSPTTLNFNAGADGQRITLELIQDATGSRLVTWGTGVVFGTDIASITLTTTASKRDIIGLIYSSSSAKWLVVGYARGF